MNGWLGKKSECLRAQSLPAWSASVHLLLGSCARHPLSAMAMYVVSQELKKMEAEVLKAAGVADAGCHEDTRILSGV